MWSYLCASKTGPSAIVIDIYSGVHQSRCRASGELRELESARVYRVEGPRRWTPSGGCWRPRKLCFVFLLGWEPHFPFFGRWRACATREEYFHKHGECVLIARPSVRRIVAMRRHGGNMCRVVVAFFVSSRSSVVGFRLCGTLLDLSRRR